MMGGAVISIAHEYPGRLRTRDSRFYVIFTIYIHLHSAPTSEVDGCLALHTERLSLAT